MLLSELIDVAEKRETDVIAGFFNMSAFRSRKAHLSSRYGEQSSGVLRPTWFRCGAKSKILAIAAASSQQKKNEEEWEVHRHGKIRLDVKRLGLQAMDEAAHLSVLMHIIIPFRSTRSDEARDHWKRRAKEERQERKKEQS